MRIKCIENRKSTLPQNLMEFYEDSTAPLIIGKSYIVYAIQEENGMTWFNILDERTDTPWWHTDMFFEITDTRLSKYWIFNFWNDYQNIRHSIIGFPEWANDSYFYNGFVDSDSEYWDRGEESWRIFNAYKKLMDVEFPDPEVTEAAQIGDGSWLICPLCIDAFESNTPDALVICPRCKTLLNNPRYKNELPTYKQ